MLAGVGSISFYFFRFLDTFNLNAVFEIANISTAEAPNGTFSYEIHIRNAMIVYFGVNFWYCIVLFCLLVFVGNNRKLHLFYGYTWTDNSTEAPPNKTKWHAKPITKAMWPSTMAPSKARPQTIIVGVDFIEEDKLKLKPTQDENLQHHSSNRPYHLDQEHIR